MTPITLRFETCLPDGLDTIAEVVEDVTALNATACGEETADITSDVTTDVECLRVIDTDTLYPKTETADTGEDNGLPVRQSVLEDLLQLRYHTDDRTLGKTTVPTGFSGNLLERYLTLTHCFRKVFPIRAAALDVVLD